jgi:hypothetical protein
LFLLIHDHFEQLCAAAVTGQITRDELLTLQEHMETCANCRDFVGDVGQVVGPAVTEYVDKHSPVRLPKGVTKRFIAKAHSEGIPLGKLVPQGRWPRHQQAVVLIAVAAFIALTCVSLYPKFLAEEWRSPNWTSKLAQPPLIPTTPNEATDLRRENAELKEQLRSFQSQAKVVAARLVSLQEALKTSDGRGAELNSRLNILDNRNDDLRKHLEDRDAQTAQLSGNLDRMTSLKEANEIALQAKESELATLQGKMEILTSELQKSEQLSVAAEDAKEIIGARNLLMFDVGDFENGKRQRPYGRVFYADGKKLTFYAFDLKDSRTLDAKIQFYVWGEKNGARGPVKILGVLNHDSARQGRWKLDCNDPTVLAEIDSVFVTVESNRRPVTAPSGEKILYAYFGDRLNHP